VKQNGGLKRETKWWIEAAAASTSKSDLLNDTKYFQLAPRYQF
jgi:hypothetical protein